MYTYPQVHIYTLQLKQNVVTGENCWIDETLELIWKIEAKSQFPEKGYFQKKTLLKNPEKIKQFGEKRESVKGLTGFYVMFHLNLLKREMIQNPTREQTIGENPKKVSTRRAK